MAKTSWYNPGAVFTNNDTLVTVANEGNTINNPSIYKNGLISAEGFLIEIDYVYYNGSTLTIVLHEGWPGGGGTFGIRMFPGAGAIAGTAMDLATLAQLYEELATSASATAVADSVGLRTSTGAFKVNNANNLDEAVNLSQLGTVYNQDFYSGAYAASGNDAVLRQGDFGFGSEAQSPVEFPNDATQMPTSMGRDGDATNGYPLFGYAASILNMRYNTTRQGQLAIAHGGGVPRIGFRTMVSNDVWSDSYDLFGEHNSVNPLDYGIGGVKTLTSGSSLLDSTLDNGLYYIPSATDTPSAQTANWVVLVNTTNNVNYRTIKAWGVGKLGSEYGEFTNTLENGVWDGWRTVFDSGNSVNPLDYGIGTSTSYDFTADDLNDAIFGTIWHAGGNTINRPPANTNYSGITLPQQNGNNVTQIAVGINGDFLYRSRAGGTWDSEWTEVYHSGNTNFNEFGGTNTGDVIGIGFCVSGTTARFFLPINSKVVATGATVAGTFDVRGANGGYLGTGVVPSAVGIHSNKLLAVQVDSLSVTAGEPVWLTAASATSKITAEF